MLKIHTSLAIASMLLLLSACDEKTAVAADTAAQAMSPIKNSTTMSDAVPDTKKVIDQTGVEITIPKKINAIVTGTILPYFHTWYVATNSTKEIVAMHPNSYNAAKNSILVKLSPEVLNASTSFVQNGEINIEELMKINPDVYFDNSTNEKSIVQARNAGINTVAIKTIDAAAAEPLATFNSWLILTGQITDTGERTDNFLRIGKTVQNEIYQKIARLTPQQKPNALMVHQLSEKSIVVGGKNFFGNQWLNATGANDVAENDVSGRKEVNMEQIYSWNPQIIYLTNFTPVQPEDLYQNRIVGQDWSNIDAVKNRQVFKIPLGIYRWFPPSGDAPLMLKWLANHNQPALFNYDMNKEIKSYYQNFYHYNLDDEDIKRILNPSSEAAKF